MVTKTELNKTIIFLCRKEKQFQEELLGAYNARTATYLCPHCSQKGLNGIQNQNPQLVLYLLVRWIHLSASIHHFCPQLSPCL